MSALKIGLTFTESRWENYPAWIKNENSEIEIIELHWEKYNLEEIWDAVEDCDGIVLTGGVDLHPRFYNNERTTFPNGDGKFNEQRDEFEMHVFETALNFHKPVLAICRGLQLVNVALGGDLIQDIEETGKRSHRRINDTDDQHIVQITENSLLHRITGGTTARVNGAHHQAVGTLSEELMVSARAEDGIMEALEWKDKADEPWLLCVQWHPERMADKETNPASVHIMRAFIEAVKNNRP